MKRNIKPLLLIPILILGICLMFSGCGRATLHSNITISNYDNSASYTVKMSNYHGSAIEKFSCSKDIFEIAKKINDQHKDLSVKIISDTTILIEDKQLTQENFLKPKIAIYSFDGKNYMILDMLHRVHSSSYPHEAYAYVDYSFVDVCFIPFLAEEFQRDITDVLIPLSACWDFDAVYSLYLALGLNPIKIAEDQFSYSSPISPSSTVLFSFYNMYNNIFLMVSIATSLYD